MTEDGSTGAGVNVLVGYESAHGSTKGIADAIGDRLGKAGFPTDVRPIDEVRGLEAYDAVVLGSAVHNRTWLPRAATFVRSHAAELVLRPVWLFSVSSVGDTTSFLGPRTTRLIRRWRKDTQELAGFRRAIRPREHRNFAGAIEPSHWNALGGLFLRVFGGRYGDHRDWPCIDAWAEEIAAELQTPDGPRRRPEEARPSA